MSILRANIMQIKNLYLNSTLIFPLSNKMLERGFNLQHREIKRWQRILNDGQLFFFYFPKTEMKLPAIIRV